MRRLFLEEGEVLEEEEEEETEMPHINLGGDDRDINLGGDDRDWESEWEVEGWEVDDTLEAPGLPLAEEGQDQDDPLKLLLEEDPEEEMDAELNEISPVAPVAKRRRKYVLDSDSD